MRLAEFRKVFAPAWLKRPGLAEDALSVAAPVAADPPPPSPPPSPPTLPPPRPAPAPSPWTANRLELAEELWGSGYVRPGGAAGIRRLAVPLGLSAASSLLLVGAGAGGPALEIATAFGCWVTGFEADPMLVAEAARLLKRADKAVAKRAAVAPWNPERPAFRARGFHHAIALDAMRTGPPKALVAAIAQALKPGGQLVVVQTVADAPLSMQDPIVARWCQLEQRPPTLPSEADITGHLLHLGFNIYVVEDSSARHKQLSLAGWKALLLGMPPERPSPARAAALVMEAELWLCKLRLINTKHLRVMRWHAVAPLVPVTKTPHPA